MRSIMTKLALALTACLITEFASLAEAAPGEVYLGRLNQGSIYKFNSSGVGTQFAAVPADWLAFDSKGNLFATDTVALSIVKITPAGSVTTFYNASGFTPGGLAFDRFGNLFVIDRVA